MKIIIKKGDVIYDGKVNSVVSSLFDCCGSNKVCDNIFSKLINEYTAIPKVEDVKVIDSNGVKVTIVYFNDGTFEKSVCQKDDTFSFEYGIGLCISKKILFDLTGENGTTVYNRLIRQAVKAMKHNRKIEKEIKQESTAEELRRKKAAEKRKKRLAKIAERKREEQIEIQAEAYRRAMNKS